MCDYSKKKTHIPYCYHNISAKALKLGHSLDTGRPHRKKCLWRNILTVLLLLNVFNKDTQTKTESGLITCSLSYQLIGSLLCSAPQATTK